MATSNAFSTYMENVIINLWRNTPFTELATVYLALFTDAAIVSELEAGTLTNEVGEASYNRIACALDAPVDGVTANTANVVFDEALTSWGTIRYIALMDSLEGGSDNILCYAQLDADKPVGVGDTFQVSAGDFDITVA